MILAAAVKFKLKNLKGEEVEVVLCGNRHDKPFNQLLDLGFSFDDIIEDTEGFITHKHEFLTRKEAFQRAVDCGQIADEIRVDRQQGREAGGTNLISEDLW